MTTLPEPLSQHHHWWKEAIVYQIYPRSFRDSNGNGSGDLKGILEKIDYIHSLGVDAVWLNPIYPSPNDDGGYDISDYIGIQPEFGTMQDFDNLLKALHQRGIRLIMDLVVNHSSDEHAWFATSRQSKENSFREYYFWRQAVNGGPPNNWTSFFGGSAWEWDTGTEEYYLHLFSKKQPDLNWENEKVREEIKKLMHFWLMKGVDGLRLDVISLISKQPEFRDSPYPDFNQTLQKEYANGPRVREFLTELRKEVWDQYEVLTIGEGPGITVVEAMNYLDPENGLSMIFHFDHMTLDQGPGGRFDPISWNLKDFKLIFKKWDDAVSENGWTSVFLGNHDYPRMVSRWGNDSTFHDQSAKLLITLLMTLRGTPFIFQGDEIGMTNLKLDYVNESKDIETINAWVEAKKKGLTENQFLEIANSMGRDNARSPLQWEDNPQAGFSKGIPWMKINPNYKEINISKQDSDPNSILNYFRQMVALRKSNAALVYGSYIPSDADESPLFLYSRILDQETWIIILNFSSSQIKKPSLPASEKIMGNYPDEDHAWIRPWESSVHKCILSK